MTAELVFRVALAIVSLAVAIIRAYYGRLAIQSGGKVSFKRASRVRTVLIWLVGVTATSASSLYVVLPEWMAWAALPLAVVLRWLGVGLGILTVLLFWWVHRTLGKNWSMPGEIKEMQDLITDGPYRWVRHPMYSTLFVWTPAYFLMSANWFIGFAWLALGLLSAMMVKDEEASLIEKFGEAYRAYMKRTGRFLPRIG